MNKIKKITIPSLLLSMLLCTPLQAEEREELIPYGDMNQWVTRIIKESLVIGGEKKSLYELGPTQTIENTEAYKNMGNSPWANSNVMAKVAGVVKTNTSLFPEKRGEGFCARMDTRMESVKVLGLVDITVLAAGSMFLGTVHEPIKGTKNPQSMLCSGIPFTKRPKAIRFDYKVNIDGKQQRIRCTGFSPQTAVEGMDEAAVILLLQKRWEDEKGNVFSKRVGTMVIRYTESSDWVNGATYPIIYGDARKSDNYRSFMRIQVEERYTLNSKGKSVPIQEVGWADADDTPTHIVLQFTSSHGGAYIGTPGNSLWIDNVRFVYDD